MIIRRKVQLKTHQGWTDKILEHLHEVPYYEWRVAEYEEGLWESEDLMEAVIGTTYAGESASYIYEHEVMSEEEYDEWVTMSGTTSSG